MDPSETSVANSLADVGGTADFSGAPPLTAVDTFNVVPTGKQMDMSFLNQEWDDNWDDTKKELYYQVHVVGVRPTPESLAQDATRIMERQAKEAADANDPMKRMQIKELEKKIADFDLKPEEDKARALENVYIMRDALSQLRNHYGRKNALGYKTMKPEYMFGLSSTAQDSTAAAGFEELIKQLQGGTFRVVFPDLRGGGPVTNIEGEKAQASVNRLSTRLPEKDFIQAENDLENWLDMLESRIAKRPIEQIKKARQPAAPAADPSRTPAPSGSPAPAPTPAPSPAQQAASTNPLKEALAQLGEEEVIRGRDGKDIRVRMVKKPDGAVRYVPVGPVQ